MEKVNLGSVSCSRVVQGYWRLTSWELTAKELAAQMKACVEMGVTTFDTAEVYGGTECESQMGAAFAQEPSLKGQVQVVTKTGIKRGAHGGYYDTSYDSIMAACKGSLARLGLDVIDVYLIHREDPMMDPWETAAALAELKQQGLVREVGVSNFDPFKFNALNTAAGGALATNQIEWNPLCFEHFKSGMIDRLMEKKVRPMVWSPLAGGRLFTGEEEQARKARAVLEELAAAYGQSVSTLVYAWILQHPAGALPLCGSQNPSRLAEAVQALEVRLSREDWYRIYTASGQMQLR